MDVLNQTTTTETLDFTTAIPNYPNTVTFTWYDYSFFTLMLGASVGIGIYFGCFGNKQSTTSEYLLGGKQMKVIPIAISLVASHISGITLLAVPADVYKYGAAYQIGSISIILVTLATIYVFLPVFYKLEITSTYEYLELRFNRRTRQFASFLFGLSIFLYLPIVIYVPALAFAAATGVSVHLIAPIVCGICIFYTTIGGLKAVVWTDTLQFSITCATLVTVFIMGLTSAGGFGTVCSTGVSVHLIAPIVCGICIFYTTIGGLKAVVWTDTLQFSITCATLVTVFIMGLTSAGGFGTVWNKSLEGQRLNLFDFDPDPTKRDTFWIITLGLTFHWIAQTSVNQSCIQKFLAVPSLKCATMSSIYYAVGTIIIKTFCVTTGLIMYAKYSSCDPFTTKVIDRNDQLLPYYVMDVAGSVPGLPGFFIAGIFSSALSTLSANLNCLAGTIYEDFVVMFLKKGHSNSSTILKIIVVITGVISTVLVLVFERLGGILPLTISIGGIVQGPLLGLFILGTLIPTANSKGAIIGGSSGMISVGFIWTMAKYYEKQGLGFSAKPISIDGCPFPLNETLTTTIFNSTISSVMPSATQEPFFLFRISYYYYTLIGSLITVIVGTIFSYIRRSKTEKQQVSRDLLSPIIHKFLPLETIVDSSEYLGINKALEITIKNSEHCEKSDK